MKISIAKIPAPDINPEALWSMSDVAFNKWRRENDYPRILSYFKREFSRFNEWQSSQNLTDDEIYEFGIGRFLRPEPAMYVYRHKAGVSPSTMFVPDDLDLSLRPLIVSKKKIIPYLTWARELKINVHPEVRDYRLFMGGWYKPFPQKYNSALFMRDIELLYAGGIRLHEHSFAMGNRHLDFLNIDGLSFEPGYSAGHGVYLYYSSANNVTVNTDIAFVYGYGSHFRDFSAKSVRLQDWHFESCEISGVIENSVLFRWSVKNSGFSPMLLNVELQDSDFSYELKYSGSVKPASEFYGMVRRLYASKGRFSEAGKYYYLEKVLEGWMYLNPFFHFHEKFPPKIHYNGTFMDIWRSYKAGDFY